MGNSFETMSPLTDNSVYVSDYFPHLRNISVNNNDRQLVALYDATTGEKLPFNEHLPQIFDSNSEYYFHGTSQCNALFIFLQGLQEKYFTNGMLGKGFYLTDNIQKTYFYGNYVFIGKISFINKFIIPRTSQNDIERVMQNLDLNLTDNDILKLNGIYDRFGNENPVKKQFYDASSFNEYLVPSVGQISLKYILQIEKINMTNIETTVRYKTICIIDVDSKFLSNYHEMRHIFEPSDMINLRKHITESKNLVYFESHFQLLLYNMHLKSEYLLNLETEEFEHQLPELKTINQLFFYDYHYTPGEYVLAMNIYKNYKLLTIDELKIMYRNVQYNRGDLCFLVENDTLSFDVKYIIGRRMNQGIHKFAENLNVYIFSKPIYNSLED